MNRCSICVVLVVAWLGSQAVSVNAEGVQERSGPTVTPRNGTVARTKVKTSAKKKESPKLQKIRGALGRPDWNDPR